MWLVTLIWDAFWELVTAIVVMLVATDITRRVSQLDASLRVIDQEFADLIPAVN